MYKQDNILILQNRYTHIPKGKITFLYGKLYNSRQIVYKTIQNTEKYNTHEGEIIVSKIDFGPGKVGLIWNAKDRCAEAWMNRPVISDISSVIPKEGEEYISQEDIDYDNACFDADMRDFEEAAAAWDARTSKEDQDYFINNRH